MTTIAPDSREVEAIADRAIGYLSGAAVSALVHLGDQLGLYRALREAGAVTSAELAARSLGLPEAVARRMTEEAGFTRFTVRDFGNALNSFYEVRP